MFRKITAASLSMLTITASMSSMPSIAQESPEMHKVTFIDFDGGIVQEIEVPDNQVIKYEEIDTDYLNGNVDIYTQREFIGWDKMPETVTEDTYIYALAKTGVITIAKFPSVIDYFDREGKIDLSGLSVYITILTDLPEVDKNGVRKVKKSVEDISNTCFTSPKNLNEAFKKSDTARVHIYPMNSDLSIYDYEITCRAGKGDVNMDGAIDASDASIVLSYYAKVSVGGKADMSDRQKSYCDVDKNNEINSIDASYILSYYALNATGKNPSWDKLIKTK